MNIDFFSMNNNFLSFVRQYGNDFPCDFVTHENHSQIASLMRKNIVFLYFIQGRALDVISYNTTYAI